MSGQKKIFARRFPIKGNFFSSCSLCTAKRIPSIASSAGGRSMIGISVHAGCPMDGDSKKASFLSVSPAANLS
jgi:hypothetical protein